MTCKKVTLVLAFSALVVVTSGDGIQKIFGGILPPLPKIEEPPLPNLPKLEDVANNMPKLPSAEDIGKVIPSVPPLPNLPKVEDVSNKIPKLPSAEDIGKVIPSVPPLPNLPKVEDVANNMPKIPSAVMPVPPTKEEMDKALPPKVAVNQTVPDVKSDTSAKPGETASSATLCQLHVCAFLILANRMIHHLW